MLTELTKGLPADLVVRDPEREKQFREIAKAANLSTGEANELIKRQLGAEIAQKQQQAEQSKALQTQMSDLITTTWGPKKEEYTQDANNWFRHMGIDGDALAVVNSALGSKPEARLKFLELARQQGASLREGGQPVPGSVPGAGSIATMTQQQAGQAKRDYLSQGDNSKAFMQPNHPNHQTVSDYVGKLARRERGL